MNIKTLVTSVALATFATGAMADDTSTVTAFYDLLSNPGSQEQVAAFQAATSDTWDSVGDYSGTNKSAEAFIGRWAALPN